ncbi:MAG: ribonuclease HI family protein [Patescibacteria group bacterium]|jgi:ribonuclease HI
MNKKLIIYTDGGARGNPGPSGIGVVIYDAHKKPVKEFGRYIGEGTNNQAEYQAVIDALAAAEKLGAEEIDFYLDSELVVMQLRGEYKVKNKDLGSLFVKVYNLTGKFKKITYRHIRREENRAADRLVNQALDAAMTSGK